MNSCIRVIYAAYVLFELSEVSVRKEREDGVIMRF